MNVISKYCNSYLGLKYMFKTSDCYGRDIYTVFVMYHICHKLEHWALILTWFQCLCLFQLSVTRHIFNKICYTKSDWESSLGGSRCNPVHIKRVFCLRHIYLCCQSVTITITIMLYSIVLLDAVSSCSVRLCTALPLCYSLSQNFTLFV
jgi:hypothetical protein